MPWSDQFLSNRGIRNLCRKQLLEEIFSPLKIENEWKILIVDEFAIKILSSCFKTEELIAYNIAVIENLESNREPVPYFSAIYMLYPSVQNIGFLQIDFVTITPKYMNVHLFFLSTVPREMFNELVKYTKPGAVKSFKEIDFLYLPCESQVYSLDDRRFFREFFDAYKELNIDYCRCIARNLATLCATLKIYPRIRYRRHFVKNFILAEAVQKELNFYCESFASSSSKLGNKLRYELLILDRGFDCISPVVHECTLQAMAFDLLDIQDDIYVYGEEENGEKNNEISLTEADSLWCKLRHEHIANVSKIIDGMFETTMLLKRYPKVSQFKKLPELGEEVRKHLAYRKTQPHAIYRRMANECMKMYCSGINVISELEQNLASDYASTKASSKDVKASLLNILGNNSYSITQKLRVLLLYIFYKKGVTKQEFDDIITSSELPFSEARIITNVLHLDVDIFRPGFCKSVDYVQKENSSSTSTLLKSKWVPAIKNIILSCVDGSLTEEMYPYLDSNVCETLMPSKRTGYWCSDKKSDHVSRLIVFIAGGVTYSEMRSVYEVMSKHKGWEVYIGGDSILTPKRFLDKLKELRCFISKDM